MLHLFHEEFKYYIGPVESTYCPITHKKCKQLNTSELAPPICAIDEYQFFNEEKNEWEVKKRSLLGMYYAIKNGTALKCETEYMDLRGYTDIAPPLSGDIYFDDECQEWRYYDNEQERDRLINKKIKTLDKICDIKIQTIPAVRRSVIIGDDKKNDKTYTDTWFHFHQRCQNILNDKERYTLEERQSATWVVEQVEKYSAIKRKIKKKIKTMTLDELQSFDPKDPAWWVNGG